LPIAGNDDSLVCLNYYCYLVSRNAVFGKIKNLIRFKKIIKYKFSHFHLINELNIKKKMLLVYFYDSNIKKKFGSKYNILRKQFIKEYEKPVDFYSNIG
jgi:hypothetical protein